MDSLGSDSDGSSYCSSDYDAESSSDAESDDSGSSVLVTLNQEVTRPYPFVSPHLTDVEYSSLLSWMNSHIQSRSVQKLMHNHHHPAHLPSPPTTPLHHLRRIVSEPLGPYTPQPQPTLQVQLFSHQYSLVDVWLSKRFQTKMLHLMLWSMNVQYQLMTRPSPSTFMLSIQTRRMRAKSVAAVSRDPLLPAPILV